MLISKVWEDSFQKKTSHERINFFEQKKLWGGCSNRRTNDQIMPKFGRSFINYKCIFH